MSSRLMAIAVKELLVFFKDPSAVALTFLMPLMFIVVMSVALGRLFGNDEGQPLQIIAVDGDEGPHAEAVIKALNRLESFTVETSYDGEHLTAERARTLVRDGRRGVAIIFPAQFSSVLERPPREQGDEVTVELIVDPALSLQFVDPVHATVVGLIRERAFSIIVPAVLEDLNESSDAEEGRGGGRALSVFSGAAIDHLQQRARVELVYAAGDDIGGLPDTYQQNVPGYTIFGVFWIVALLSGSIVRERQEGTFKRLKAAPLSRWTVLGGKMLPYLGINLLQVAIMLGASHLIFDMDLGPSVAGLVIVSFGAACTATALGVLVATVVQTDAQAGSLSTLLLLTLSALGGCFVPRFIMPEWLRSAGLVTPQAWALEAYQDLLVRGQGLSEVLPEAGVLLLFAGAFFTAGIWRFRLD